MEIFIAAYKVLGNFFVKGGGIRMDRQKKALILSFFINN